MDNELLERVAQAMCDRIRHVDLSAGDYTLLAQAALQALRPEDRIGKLEVTTYTYLEGLIRDRRQAAEAVREAAADLVSGCADAMLDDIDGVLLGDIADKVRRLDLTKITEGG